MSRKQFIERMTAATNAAIQVGAAISLPFTVAQAAHESGWGRSTLAVKGNNLFGVKAGHSWRGPTLDLPTWEYLPGIGKVRGIARWRKYATWPECILDYAKVLKLPWFVESAEHVNDPYKFLACILPAPPSKAWPKGKPGWATDPLYAEKIVAVGKAIEAMGGPKWEVGA